MTEKLKEIIYLPSREEKLAANKKCAEIILSIGDQEVEKIAYILHILQTTFEKSYGIKLTVMEEGIE